MAVEIISGGLYFIGPSFGLTGAISASQSGVSSVSTTSTVNIPSLGIVVAMGFTDGYNTGSSTMSGGGLSWTRRVAIGGSAEIWTAYNSGTAINNTSITWTSGTASVTHIVEAIIVIGGDSTQLTNTSSGTWGPLTNWTGSLTAGGSSSYILTAAYTYSGQGFTLTPNAGTTNEFTINNPAGGVACMLHNTTPSSGTINLSGTWSSSVSGYNAYLEVRSL